MNCERFREARLDDDAIERREAELHAEECPDCQDLLESDRALALAVQKWKEATPAPGARLGRRIGEAIRREDLRHGSTGPKPAWILVAAAALLAAALVVLNRPQPPSDPTAGLESTLDRIERLGADYARAIAELEQRAEIVLARAGDPELEPEDAALLLSYRDRLSHLDAVILEVRSYLDRHPGNASGHTVLLAAYDEKQEVLRELLGLHLEETS